MILIGTEDHGREGSVLPDVIAASALLEACAAEVRRQAADLAALDRALGVALAHLRRSDTPPLLDGAHLSVVMRELQGLDRLRQESEGLARTMALLARVQDLSQGISAQDLRGCTVMAALHARLLAPPE